MSVGVPVAIALTAVVFLESGSALAALVALVVLSVFNSALMARRMSRFWPGARDLSGGDRVAVVRSCRGGRDIGQPRLAWAVIDYTGALREARLQASRYRWVVWLCAAVVVVLAVVDSVIGPWRVTVVSWLFVAFFAVELFWWPGRQDRLLANAEHAARSARRALEGRR